MLHESSYILIVLKATCFFQDNALLLAERNQLWQFAEQIQIFKALVSLFVYLCISRLVFLSF